MKLRPYPLVDLFAGLGGLGEGFASVQGECDERRFCSVLSIEKDEVAHKTLQLRHFFRAFKDGEAPDAYYDYLRGCIDRDELFSKHKRQAREAEQSAQRIELGICRDHVQKLIRNRLGNKKKWVLVGGPPCQAYSLVGRARMTNVLDFEKDERHRLYREYLHILYDHRPPVFVMENVKGLLSAKVRGKSTIRRIISELKNPGRIFGNSKDVWYRLYGLAGDGDRAEGDDPRRYVVHAEDYGVPQARHRMFIVGVRDDLNISPGTLHTERAPTAAEAIGNLPKIRSRISKGTDNYEDWSKIVSSSFFEDKVKASQRISPHSFPKNHFSTRYPKRPKSNQRALLGMFDDRLSSLSGHESRSHMVSDLKRYGFAALFAKEKGKSPTLADFPIELMPDHDNAMEGRVNGNFGDRFRVQLKNKPATTITSHIAKDGHYYIHYDPNQCRSLTVREAARLQTFPDNYKFEGPRTAQYHQVGNAVPPYLARQIGEIVAQVLDSMNGKA